jgi:predicted RNase H-like nuclease (RuvC/YqgF family)
MTEAELAEYADLSRMIDRRDSTIKRLIADYEEAMETQQGYIQFRDDTLTRVCEEKAELRYAIKQLEDANTILRQEYEWIEKEWKKDLKKLIKFEHSSF